MPRDRAPSFQFYPRDFMADPDVQALTWEQRGRYHWALCCSALSSIPGIGTELEWARWMGYSAEEWEMNRDAHARCFKIHADGRWEQERMRANRAEQRARHAASRAGADAVNAKLSQEERSANARSAAQVMWNKRRSAHDEMRAMSARMPGPASASASASASQEKEALRMRAEEKGDNRPVAIPEILPAGPSWSWDRQSSEPNGPAKSPLQALKPPEGICDTDSARDAVAEFEAQCAQADADEAAEKTGQNDDVWHH